MRKTMIKQLRTEMIKSIWKEKKAIWEMKDIAYLFGLSLPQVYRILAKGRSKQLTNKK